jgi:plastocyanin
MRLTALAVLATGVLVAAGCGGGSSGSSSSSAVTTPSSMSSGGHGSTVEIDVADNGFMFTTTSATAKAGTVTIKSMNPQSVAHDIAIKSDDGSVDEVGDEVSDGGVSTVTVDLKPGTYTYYCSVPGHEAAGMKGVLTVS